MGVNRVQIHQNKLFRLPKVCFMSIRCLQDSAPGFVADKTFQCWKSFLPDTLTSVLGLKDSHAQSSRAMPLRVLLQSRLGWPFEAMKDLDAIFGEVLQEFAANKGWHPSVFTLYVGDKLVQPETKLSECTSGAYVFSKGVRN